MTKEEKARPIAVFDSGMGGISVLKELYRLMPYEHFIYMGDSENAPYGEKSKEEVYALARHWTEYFLERQAKALVIACNTATSAAAARLRREYPELPIIGLEPALKPAAVRYAGTGKKILVMATSLTLRESKFQHLLHQYEDKAAICLLPAPKLVEYIERGEIGTDGMETYLREILAPYMEEDIGAVVLGCTHFPFARDCIRKVLAKEVEFFDGAAGASRQLKRQLLERDMLTDATEQGFVQIENSERSGGKEALSKRLFAL